MPKYREGDKVRIHQEPGYPLNERHRYLHGARGVIRVVLNGDRTGEYVVETEGSLYHLKEPNLIPDRSEDLRVYYQLIAYKDGRELKTSRLFSKIPTKEELLSYLKVHGASHVEVRKLYGIDGD